MTRLISAALIGATIAATAVAARSQPPPPKSAEEIIDGLLDAGGGVERGVRPAARRDREPQVSIPIQFEYNSAEISADSRRQIELVAKALGDERLLEYRFRVEGHTDSKGSAAYNQSLSERRARAVKAALTRGYGIDPARLEAVGYGESQPLPGVSQESDKGRALNRRVVLANVSLASAARPGPPATAKDLRVDVLVNYESGGETKVLTPGEVLRPEDNYRVSFTASHDCHVYVYQISSDEQAVLLFPNATYSPEENPVAGGRRYVVPPGGRWMSLAGIPGDEEIVLLGSPLPLPDSRATALRVRGQAVNIVNRGAAPRPRASIDGSPTDIFSYRLPFSLR